MAVYNSTLTVNPEVQMLKDNKVEGFNYKEFRHGDWTENYTLSRGIAVYNRLTQRQSVTIPLIKTQLNTYIANVDQMSEVVFENLDNDKKKELFTNEYWNWTLIKNNAKVQDVVDKKQDFLFGRTFKQWQIAKGFVKFTVIDPIDVLLSKFTDPTNINSSRFLIHVNIFEPLATIKENKEYDQEAVNKLIDYHGTQTGMTKAAGNEQILLDKNDKLNELGMIDVFNPILGETYVEINLHFVYRKEEGDDEEQLYLYIVADDYCILKKDKLENIIGQTKDHFWRNHYPYSSWASDVERQHVWSDGKADGLRPLNKLLNAWASQMAENRTLRNLGMMFYDSTAMTDFKPQTFEPKAFGVYGIPVGANKKLDDVFKKVDIPDLSESLDEMQYIQQIGERLTGISSTQQGQQNERSITLGEVQLMLGASKERINNVSLFYTKAWEDDALIFLKLIEAAPDKLDAVTLYKKGRNTETVYPMTLEPEDWMSESGYNIRVWSQEEKKEKDIETLQNLSAAKGNMPDNPVVDQEYKRKLMEFGGMKPDKVEQALEFEKAMQQVMMQQKIMMAQQPPLPAKGQPTQQALPVLPQQ